MKWKKVLTACLFTQHMFIEYVPDTVLGAGTSTVSKTDTVPDL